MGWGAVPPQAPSLLAPLRLLHPLPRAGPWSSGDHSPHCLYTQGINNTSHPRCPQFLTRPKPLIQDPFIKPSSCQFKQAILFLPTSTILSVTPDGSSFQPPSHLQVSTSHIPSPKTNGLYPASSHVISPDLPSLTVLLPPTGSILLSRASRHSARGASGTSARGCPTHCALICRRPQG